MEPLDGNAIAGALFEHFGAEMTTTAGTCQHCGSLAQIAELVVYSRAPGSVARCRSCGNVVMVLIETGGAVKIDFSRFRLGQLARPDAASDRL
jgi:ribosomal protein S27E